MIDEINPEWINLDTSQIDKEFTEYQKYLTDVACSIFGITESILNDPNIIGKSTPCTVTEDAEFEVIESTPSETQNKHGLSLLQPLAQVLSIIELNNNYNGCK